jgi:hypothetical protein
MLGMSESGLRKLRRAHRVYSTAAADRRHAHNLVDMAQRIGVEQCPPRVQLRTVDGRWVCRICGAPEAASGPPSTAAHHQLAEADYRRRFAVQDHGWFHYGDRSGYETVVRTHGYTDLGDLLT